jgi:L-ribulokinase
MEMKKREDHYIIGMDFGTDSVRALLAHAGTWREIAVAVSEYRRWSEGLYCDGSQARLRQHPLDYLEGMERVLRRVVSQCPDPEAIRAISVDTTASTPCLVDRELTPLSLTPGYETDPDAMFVLWKDHTAQCESGQITSLCARGEVNYASHSGGYYSSECFWAKVLHLLRSSQRLRRDAWAAIELCDWIPSVLTGCRSMEELRIGKCVAGSKMMWSGEWGGYPPEEFFAELDPAIAMIRNRLPAETYGCDSPAGVISALWAEKLGLSRNLLVGVGNIDAHSGAVGAGIGRGRVVLNLGTSSCYMAVMPSGKDEIGLIDGIFGQVDGSILPGMVGFEAGMSAFGDVYAWFRRLLCWPLDDELSETFAFEDRRMAVGRIVDGLLDRLAEAAARLPLRYDAPIATDHLNGRRTPYPCSRLTGSLVGLNLSTSAPEIYYAFAEATAFATKAIIDHLSTNGVDIEQLVAIGGIAQKSPFVMQLLADVTGMRLHICGGSNSCAMGAVINGATLSGVYESVEDAQKALCPHTVRAYEPDRSKAEILSLRYGSYRALGAFCEDRLSR